MIAELDEMGIAHTAPDLPHTSVAADVRCAREAITRAGPTSVVIGHSYGGIVISNAASGLADLNRLIYLAAFMAESDVDLASLLSTADSRLIDGMDLSDNEVRFAPDMAREVFYADSDDETAAWATARLRGMGIAGEPIPPVRAAWHDIESTYVVCTRDAALPPEVQRGMASNATDKIEWPSDHSPFLTRPREIALLCASYL